MRKIPLCNVSFDKQEAQAVCQVLRSGWLSIGSVTNKFEQKFAKFLGVKHAVSVSSCTAALHLANLALNVGEGDELICPSLTFVSAANSILYTGARPVFVDVTDFSNFNISPADIEKKITRRTRAIQVMHYAGFPCDMKKILDTAKKYELRVIEDCAHAIGASYGMQKCGSIGDIGCFSFFSNKNMTTGEGGMVTTNNDKIANRIRIMRSHGMTSSTLKLHKGHAFNYDIKEIGFNYRIDELRSAIGIVQLSKLNDNNVKREGLVESYRRRLKGISEIGLPFSESNAEVISANHIFPVLLEKGISRIKFRESMRRKGIQTSVHYSAIHLFDFYRRKFGFDKGMLPNTEDVACREVTLPLYPAMKDKDVNYICNAIIDFFRKRKGRK